MHLKDAPKELAEKHYFRYTGKYSKSSSWTLLKKYLVSELEQLDKECKKQKRKLQYALKHKSKQNNVV